MVWGGQHIRTCDGADMSFWETCHYVLAQPQQPVPGVALILGGHQSWGS